MEQIYNRTYDNGVHPGGNYTLIHNEGGNATMDAGPRCCMPGSEQIIVPVIFSVVVLTGCVGNSLVLIVVLKNRDQFRSTTNLFILNLAMSDLLFLLFCVPFHAVIYTIPTWPFGGFMCKFVHLIQYSSMVASIMTLVIMSVDRYLAVAHPLGTKHIRTPAKALVISIFIWIVSICVALPWPVFYTVKIYDQFGPVPLAVCADDWGQYREHRPTYFLILFLVSYALPLLVIGILSAMMVYELWNMQHLEGHAGQESNRAKKKVTRLVISVVAVFFICWFPSHLVWLWTNYFREHWMQMTYSLYYFRVMSHVLSYANSAMNPIIYAFLSENFRRGFYKALKCGRRARPSLVSGATKSVYTTYNATEDHPIMHTTVDTTV